VEGKLAGFVLANRQTYLPGNEWSISEFFIMRKYRRHGVGRAVAFSIFDRFRGKWEVREVECNAPSLRFWRSVIAEYTGGKYSEIRWNSESSKGSVQCFDNAEKGISSN
jgi:predicted acetyltransferase